MGSDRVAHAGLVKLLAGIGAIIFIILAIFSFSLSAYGIICGLLLLVVGIIVLISCFGSGRQGIPFTPVFLLFITNYREFTLKNKTFLLKYL